MSKNLSQWNKLLGNPDIAAGKFSHGYTQTKVYEYPEFFCEYYTQNNFPGKCQQVIKVVPKQGRDGKFPAVAVPFYYPEAMLGEIPATGEILERYSEIRMMFDLVRRGYVAISARAYHLTIYDSERDIDDFQRWYEAAENLQVMMPGLTGIGKLVLDTVFLVDMLCEDPRVDSSRLGIAGHSLGGKMAFYTGCLDPRIKVLLCSDFGLLWEQSNWEKPWYWGEKLQELQAASIDHADLLAASGNKPLALLAGKYDDERSLEMLKKSGYAENSPGLRFINHASGHRPPEWALNEGYNFLDSFLLP